MITPPLIIIALQHYCQKGKINLLIFYERKKSWQKLRFFRVLQNNSLNPMAQYQKNKPRLKFLAQIL